MMPYINPNYFNQPQYQSMYQMPQTQLPTYNQPVSNTTPMNTLGKYVDSMEVVKATEVPMDGQTYYFPKADGSIIYSKQWLPNGTTKIGSYSPNKALENEKVDNVSSETVEGVLGGITQAIEVLREQVDAMIENTKPVSRGRKAVNNESNADN